MVSTQGLVATITNGVDRELEEIGGRSPSPSLDRGLGINKALKSALPKASPPSQQTPQGCVPVPGRRGALGRERAECAAAGVYKESANELGLRVYGHLEWTLEVE